MSPLRRGLVLAAIHLAIVSSLGAKLLYDRATRPRAWVETAPYDPDMPIRGRYVSLALVVEPRDIERPADDQHGWQQQPVILSVEEDRLVARRDPVRTYAYAGSAVRFIQRGDRTLAILGEPVAFFIPEHAEDPSRRREGETLWVEVTLPRKGPPRPIRLGVRKDGVLTPLSLR